MEDLEKLQQAIAALEAQRPILGADIVDAALTPLREKLAALQAAAQPEVQRKQATLLFMDMAGHTALTHHLDPEEQMEIVDQALAQLAEPVAQHGGRVVRYQGDGFKAVFGLPAAGEDDPDNAVRAGLAIQAVAGEIAAELERRRGMRGFAVRVGIATGLVLGGGGTEGDAGVRGEPVNLAARMESAAQPGAVLIAHSTYRNVRGSFDVLPLPPVKVKGFDEPVPVYQVLREKNRSFHNRKRGVEGVETRMVGREVEFRKLRELYASMIRESRRQFVTVVGEPGLGKSRLLYEFENWVQLRSDHPQIFRGRARLETARLPFGLLRDLLATEFDIQDSDSEALAAEKLERGMNAAAGPGSADWAAFIGHLIGFHSLSAASPHLQGIHDDAQQIHDLAFRRAIQFFKAVLNKQPVLIFLEDIHWADDGSLDFFEQLARETAGFHLMIICLARNTLFERRPAWGAGQAHERIDLAPLTDQDSQQLVSEILRHLPEIPPSIHNLIVSQAEGNPFYVEEVIKMLIDDGVVVPGKERWQVHNERFVAGRIPPTLTGVLQARLDSLPLTERKVLDRASVAGREFWDDLTARMQDLAGVEGATGLAQMGSLAEIERALGNLQGRELIYRKDQSAFSDHNEYIFKHVVLRDVTYERLLTRLRRTYHLQVAEWLSDHGGQRVGDYAGRIGEHYERGGEGLRAAEWYCRAGKQAQDTYAPEMARDYYQKALSIWEQAGDLSEEQSALKIEALQGLGQVQGWLGQYGAAVETFLKMAEAAEAWGDLLYQARAWHGAAETQMHRGEARLAIESAERAEALALQAEAELDLSKALWMQAWGALRLGEVEKALRLAGQVSELSQGLQDRSQMAHSLNLLGVLASVEGRYAEAECYFQQALEIFNLLGNRRRAMPLMNNLGVILEARGDYPKAQKRYQEALDTAREIGNRDGEMVYLSNLGGVKVRLGDYAAAEANLLQVIEMAGSGGLGVLPSTHSYLAEAYIGQGRVQQALAAAQKALALAEKMESQQNLGLAWRVLGQATAAMHAPAPVKTREDEQPRRMEAQSCFAESERIFREIKREDERARTLQEWARYEFNQENRDAGKRLWEEARLIFERLGALSELERMETVHAKE